MSYIPTFEASKALPVEYIINELEDFAASGQNLSGRRFSRSPPRVSSVPSTKYEESESPSPITQLQDKEGLELEKSTPDMQFSIQVLDELGRIRAARDKGLLQHESLFGLDGTAEANVKYRWIQQGIWDERWDGLPYRVWKHELQDPPSPERASDSIKQGEIAKSKSNHKSKLSELEEEYHEISQRAVDYQKRQSSRPCYQFIYQSCQEREWIKMGLSDQDQDQHTNLDTRAYETVKSRWMRDCIWDDDWVIIPGTSWRHERPRKTPDPRKTYEWQDARKAAQIEHLERPPRWYPMAPVAPLTRINWPSRQPVPLEAAFEPSILELNAAVKRSLRKRSMTSQPHTHASPRSTHKSTAKAQPAHNGQEQNEPRTKSAAPETTANPARTKPGLSTLQKRKFDTTQSRIAESRPVKKRIAVNKEEDGAPTPGEETAADARASRPRRAAATRAMKNLTRSI